MTKKPFAAVTLVLLLLLFPLLQAFAAPGKGVNRERIKEQNLIYPATLSIGSMSFRGRISRMDKATDSEIEEAIKKALDEMGLTELEVGEAQALVEKVAKDEELTKEDVDAVMDNLFKLAGVDSLAELLKVMFGDSSKSFTEAMADYAADEVKGKALDWILEQIAEGGSEVFSVATKLLDMVVISMDQYEKDQQKWKNRVDAANAERMLNEFYDKVNETLDNMQGMRSRGWSLQIEDTANRNFTFFGVEGNMETWTVNMLLKKFDTGDNVSASGTYTGIVSITVEYEMSEYDKGFKDWCINKSGFYDTYIAAVSAAGKLKLDASDDYEKTYIHRNLTGDNFSTSLSVPVAKGQSVRSQLSFSDFEDIKDIAIQHKITVLAKLSGKVKMTHDYELQYSSENEEALSVNTTSNVTVTAGGKTITNTSTDKQKVKWDSSIWEQWEKEKWLEITYP